MSYKAYLTLSIGADSEDSAIDGLMEYLADCVRHEDSTGFHIEQDVSKEIVINNILDGASDNTKLRVKSLLEQLPFSVLADANPYAQNSSDDCHTFS